MQWIGGCEGVTDTVYLYVYDLCLERRAGGLGLQRGVWLIEHCSLHGIWLESLLLSSTLTIVIVLTTLGWTDREGTRLTVVSEL
jgi:hypothetical protein